MRWVALDVTPVILPSSIVITGVDTADDGGSHGIDRWLACRDVQEATTLVRYLVRYPEPVLAEDEDAAEGHHHGYAKVVSTNNAVRCSIQCVALACTPRHWPCASGSVLGP